MTQRVASDHASVTSIDAVLAPSGAADRPSIEIPAEHAGDFTPDEVVRLVLDEKEYRARIQRPLTGDTLQILGAYDTPRLARNPGEGENRLHEWFEDGDLDLGRTVHLDVVEADFLYGVRRPGERAVYEVKEKPDESLSAIARDLEGDD